MAYTFDDLSEEDLQYKDKEYRKKVLDWVLSPIDTAKKKILERSGSIPTMKAYPESKYAYKDDLDGATFLGLWTGQILKEKRLKRNFRYRIKR